MLSALSSHRPDKLSSESLYPPESVSPAGPVGLPGHTPPDLNLKHINVSASVK